MSEIIREFSTEEIIHIRNENSKLINENRKLRFANNIIHRKNENLKIENERLKRNKDVNCIVEKEKKFNTKYISLVKEKDELNEVIVGLKKEIEYYKELIKKYNKKGGKHGV